ncbi:MAG TPA: hypothetical protein VEH10_03795 [Thermoplasmata archaeon]|nr:hypothetical protein [Thermoplasmata archaeon]
MAKKVRRKLDEEAEAKAFDFPVFDEVGFAKKEFALTGAVALASGVAVLLGALAWLCTSVDLPWYVPFPLGFLVTLLSPTFLGRLTSNSSVFTKGDWAGIVALEFFGFLAVWFLLVNVV